MAGEIPVFVQDLLIADQWARERLSKKDSAALVEVQVRFEIVCGYRNLSQDSSEAMDIRDGIIREVQGASKAQENLSKLTEEHFDFLIQATKGR